MEGSWLSNYDSSSWQIHGLTKEICPFNFVYMYITLEETSTAVSSFAMYLSGFYQTPVGLSGVCVCVAGEKMSYLVNEEDGLVLKNAEPLPFDSPKLGKTFFTTYCTYTERNG